MSELPKGWYASTLGDICYKISDGSHNPPKASDTGKPMISARNIIDQMITFDGCRLISDAEFERENKRTNISIGDVLLTIVGTIGRAALVETLDRPFTTQRSVSVLKPTAAILPKYLLYSVLNPEFQKLMDSKASGTAQRGVYLRTLGELPVRLAPLNEQKRIVAKLDELLQKVEACKQRLEKIPTILKRFRQSVLAAAVSGKLTEGWRNTGNSVSTEGELPKTWANKGLGELIVSLDQGWSPQCENFASESEEKWAVIKTTAVQQGKFVEAENKQLPSSLETRPNLEIRAGDLLITRAGPRVRCGICCLVRQTRKRLMICDKVYRFRVDEKLILPEFVELFLNASSTLLAIEELKTGISDSGVNLTQGKFRNLKIVVPPIEEQSEILRQVAELLDGAEHNEERWRKVSSYIERLGNAILSKAFAGELTYQDPTDEPALILLERLKSSSATSTNGSKPKRTRKTKDHTASATA